MNVVIALGSNLGDRELYINTAIEELSAVIKIEVVSSVMETVAVGGPEQGDYLNAVLIGECDHNPLELMQLLLQIESRLGRVRDVQWGPRTIDLDFIAAGNLIIRSAELQLPHPRAQERLFVLQPWDEIDPQAFIPRVGKVKDLLAGLR